MASCISTRTGRRLQSFSCGGVSQVVSLDDQEALVFEDHPESCVDCGQPLADTAYPVLEGGQLCAVDCVDCGRRYPTQFFTWPRGEWR